VTAPHLGPGTQVAGKYTIRALLGFTGEVATYHAASNVGQEVVLKLFDPALGQRADVMSKLERVRAQVAALPPDGVVPVFDFGYDMTTSAPFSVCEKLQIPSLSKLVETGPLSAEVVASVMQNVARVLEAAHAQQLFHHALKPTNIFVGPAPHYPVRITDFGASVVRSTSPTHEAYAQSAPWWAPEQMQPAAVIGGPADVFAAALVVFYSLTGRSFWLSCQTSPPDLPNWQIEIMGARPPVSQRAAEFGGTINAAIDGVFARALSVNQPDRPHSLAELATVLQGAPAGGYQNQPAVKTIALPEMDFPQGGNAYPPAPQPQAQPYGAPQQSNPGYPASPHGQGAPAQGPAHAPHAQAPAAQAPAAQAPTAGGPGGYAPAPGAPQPAAAHGLSDPGITPGLPPFPATPVKKKRSGSTVPIIISVVVALLVGGGAVAYLFLREPAETTAETTAASSSANEDQGAPTGSAQEDTGSGSESAGPAADTGSDDAGAEPEKVEIELTCKPDCDELLVDNEKVDLDEHKKNDNKLSLLPGKHTLEARKAGYYTRKETIVIEADKPTQKELPLQRRRKRQVPKPCGQFLNPCR